LVVAYIFKQPWKTLCGFPPNGETITLRVPNGLWRPDTVITDYEGTEMFVLLDQVQQMRSYEAIFGDLDGRRLVCIKRHLITAFWRDGYYLCTYKPNYKNQRPLLERDVDNKKVYPFSYLQVNPMKGRFYYRMFDNQEGLSPPKMRSENPWLGFMVVCCTPIVRTGKWTASFHRKNQNIPTIHVDQWRNCVDIGPGNDVLAALCMAYIFDRYQCQPLITVVGGEKEQYLQPDDHSIESNDDDKDDIEQRDGQMYIENTPNHARQDGRGERQPGSYMDNTVYNENDDTYPQDKPLPIHENDTYPIPDDKNFQLDSVASSYDDFLQVDDDSSSLQPSSYNQQPTLYDADESGEWLTTGSSTNDESSTSKSISNPNADSTYGSDRQLMTTIYEQENNVDDEYDERTPKIV
jgi:hypothetical protein